MEIISTLQLASLPAHAASGSSGIIDVPRGVTSVALWVVTKNPTGHPALAVSLHHVAPQDPAQLIVAAATTPQHGAGVKRLLLTGELLSPQMQVSWQLQGGAVDMSICCVFYGTAQQPPQTLKGLLLEWLRKWSIPTAFMFALISR